MLSPDAALVALDRWQALSAEQRRRFAPLCPDLVVELASPSVAGGFSEGVEDSRGFTAVRPKNGRLPAQRRPPRLALNLQEIWAG